MKKLLLTAAIALATITAGAQSLTLSSYAGTDIAKYNGETRNVIINRYVMTGWNTISLPFDMTAAEVDQAFGTDCLLERLVGVETQNNETTLNFMDCKAEGLKANVPYILYYNGVSANKRIEKANTKIKSGSAAVKFTDVSGTQVTFACAQKQRDAKGVYGILARDNAEASFVNVDHLDTQFYATRCFVQLSNGTSATLKTNHIAAGETTSISGVLRGAQTADVYSISGAVVGEALTVSAINSLPAGIYVVNGKKVEVK